MSQVAVAREVGAANATMVSRWERGIHVPPRDVLRKLFVWSGGLVAPNDFYDLPVLAAPAAAALPQHEERAP